MKAGEDQLEAFLSTPTDWRVSGYRADCYNGIVEPKPKDPTLCSFDKIPFISIKFTTNNYGTLSGYANSILLTKAPIYNQSTSSINLYQTWDSCSDSKTCTIDLIINEAGSTFAVGNIIVDMNNKMKILQINPQPLSGYQITQIDDNGTIEVNQVGIKNSRNSRMGFK